MTVDAMTVLTDSMMEIAVSVPACPVRDHGHVVFLAITAWSLPQHHPGSLETLSFAINGIQMEMEVSVEVVHTVNSVLM